MDELPTETVLSAEAASNLVEGIRSSFEQAWGHYADGCRQLVEAYQGKAWEPLGLADWQAFVSHTLDVDHLRIPKAERQEIVRSLRDGGLTVRAVAAATGLGVGTVHRELAPGVPNGTEPEDSPPVNPIEDWLAGLPEGAERAIREMARELDTLQQAAREAIRQGFVGLPPDDWKPIESDEARDAANRLAEWEIRVARAAGDFLTWCEGAGIKLVGRRGVQMPERLRYPVAKGEPPLPADWGEEDEHHAALGHFWTFWLRDEEWETVSAPS